MRTLDPLVVLPTLFKPLTAMVATYRGIESLMARPVPDFFGFLDKVVGVDWNAVPANHAGLVGVEVPLGAVSF